MGIHFDHLKLDRRILIRKIYEKSFFQIQKFHIILGLNSANLVEFTYRLELHYVLSVDDEIGPNVSYILILVVNWYDPFSFVINSHLSKGDFERAVIYRFGIARAEGGPYVLGDDFEKFIH